MTMDYEKGSEDGVSYESQGIRSSTKLRAAVLLSVVALMAFPTAVFADDDSSNMTSLYPIVVDQGNSTVVEYRID